MHNKFDEPSAMQVLSKETLFQLYRCNLPNFDKTLHGLLLLLQNCTLIAYIHLMKVCSKERKVMIRSVTNNYNYLISILTFELLLMVLKNFQACHEVQQRVLSHSPINLGRQLTETRQFLLVDG